MEKLITFLEGLGFTKVEAQLDFLLNPENIPFAIWETLRPLCGRIFRLCHWPSPGCVSGYR